MSWYDYFMRDVLWYVYPRWHTVSFSLIAKKHIEHLKRYYRLYEIDELSFHTIDVFTSPICLIHPYFFIITRHPQIFFNRLSKFRLIIGIDVADSNRIGKHAVELCELAHAMIVPSNFARNAYITSGVRIPVHVVPHGISQTYFRNPRIPRQSILHKLYKLKHDKGYIYTLFFLWHSDYRKGADLVYAVMKEIQKIHHNVILIVKSGGIHPQLSQLKSYFICKWLTEDELVDLYDLCDIYLLFSRGGGFELNGLEALARNEIVIATKGGAWDDYLPDFLLIPPKRYVKVFPDANPITSIHCGLGPELDVEKAIDKLHSIINNLDDYKAKVKEYWDKIKNDFTWEAVAKKIKHIIDKYT